MYLGSRRKRNCCNYSNRNCAGYYATRSAGAAEHSRRKHCARTGNLGVLHDGTSLSTQSALGRNRTFDLPLRRRSLYPLSYEGRGPWARGLITWTMGPAPGPAL